MNFRLGADPPPLLDFFNFDKCLIPITNPTQKIVKRSKTSNNFNVRLQLLTKSKFKNVIVSNYLLCGELPLRLRKSLNESLQIHQPPLWRYSCHCWYRWTPCPVSLSSYPASPAGSHSQDKQSQTLSLLLQISYAVLP